MKPATSSTLTLTLGILGSSVLPVAWAFSQTSLIIGTLTALVVAVINHQTGSILIDAATFTRSPTYESLALVVGGPLCKLLARISLVVLLFGTLCGDFALLADMGTIALEDLFPQHLSSLVPRDKDDHNHNEHMSTITRARIVLVFLAITLVLPLSCSRHIRQLERAALVGLSLVFVLMIVVCWESAAAGFPALRSGEFPLFFLSNSTSSSTSSHLPQAIAIFSFAFYTHPMLLPLLSEMPRRVIGAAEEEEERGRDNGLPSLSLSSSQHHHHHSSIDTGAKITKRALGIVTIGIAMAVYCTIGIAGAARYGLSTEGDILMNTWLTSLKWEGALGLCMALYIAISMAPFAMTLRYQLDTLFHLDEHDAYFNRNNSNDGGGGGGEEDGLSEDIANHQASGSGTTSSDNNSKNNSNSKGEEGMFINKREMGLTIATLGCALAVALTFPTESEQIFAVTGATGVTFVCYLFPIYAHYRLFFRKKKRGLLFVRLAGTVDEEEEEEEEEEEGRVPLLLHDNDDDEYCYPRFSDLLGKSAAERGAGLWRYVLKPGFMAAMAIAAMMFALAGGGHSEKEEK